MVKEDKQLIDVADRTVAISHPDKVLFPRAGHTEIDVARYYLAVAGGARRGRPAEHARALPERHRRRVLLSEARAQVAHEPTPDGMH